MPLDFLTERSHRHYLTCPVRHRHLHKRFAGWKVAAKERGDADHPFIADRRHLDHPAILHHVDDRADAAGGEVHIGDFLSLFLEHLLELDRNVPE